MKILHGDDAEDLAAAIAGADGAASSRAFGADALGERGAKGGEMRRFPIPGVPCKRSA